MVIASDPVEEARRTDRLSCRIDNGVGVLDFHATQRWREADFATMKKLVCQCTIIIYD
jgi:hypothetical protein